MSVSGILNTAFVIVIIFAEASFASAQTGTVQKAPSRPPVTKHSTPDAEEVNYSELMKAAIEADDLVKVKELVTKKPNAVNARDKNGWTPLHEITLAVNLTISLNNNATGTVQDKNANGLSDIGEFLLSHGANINAKDDSGNTPLMIAAEWGKVWIVKALIERGANVNLTDSYGGTALTGAAFGRSMDIVKMLCAAGAKLDARNKDGSTPLHIAATSGTFEIVAYLLQEGAAVNSKDAAGQTPLKRANINKHTDVAELLKQHGGIE
jgi:cytohesin